MSAALQLPILWAAQSKSAANQLGLLQQAVHHIQKRPPPSATPTELPKPLVSYAFYRRHTEKLIHRYLVASMTIGRAPTLLGETIDRGFASCRPIKTFEDALIFVLDIETCLKRLSRLDREIISRIIVQENTQEEAAANLGISSRSLGTKYPEAIDRLTANLIKADLLSLPD